MIELRTLKKYFLKYRWPLFLGILFVILSNYFGILAPQITGFVVDEVAQRIQQLAGRSTVDFPRGEISGDPLVQWVSRQLDLLKLPFGRMILYTGVILLLLALLRGFFMFLMRQTLIVMSRLIEYDQKQEIYAHYQKLDLQFFRIHATGDLMNRITEDVSRVRMFTGPAIMYLVNLIVLIGLSLYFMFSKDALLSLYTLAPLPILAVTIYWVNTTIHRRSEIIQRRLSDLTTNAQESYSGIRVIKAFGQEGNMFGFFSANSEAYRTQALGLARIESLYFPSIGLLIGVSTLLTIMIGGFYQINHRVSPGTITEFVVYINMLTFPVSALGWVASMIQRAAVSQKRINEFLLTQPSVKSPENASQIQHVGRIEFKDASFMYEHTGIKAIDNINLIIEPQERVAIVGRTGSGKTTLAQLILRFFDPQEGSVFLDRYRIEDLDLSHFRRQMGYVPQDVFLFSDTIANNIRFGKPEASLEDVANAARLAGVEEDILRFPDGYNTLVGERGVTLSGGQKQRVAIARALIKDACYLIFDDCLSAVDAKTEQEILSNLDLAMQKRTSIVITHRIFSLLHFDRIIVMDQGRIVEQGTHEDLLLLNGYYADMYSRQQQSAGEETLKAD